MLGIFLGKKLNTIKFHFFKLINKRSVVLNKETISIAESSNEKYAKNFFLKL